MEVGKRLVELRELRGYSTNRLANLAGVSQSFLRDIELGKKCPTVDTLTLLCDALGITLRDFFDEGEDILAVEEALLVRLRSLTPAQRRNLLTFLSSI